MKRSQALSLLTLALAGLPSGSLAQTPTTPTTPTNTSTGGGGVTAVLTFVGDESYNSMRGDDISKEQCESGIDLTFKLSNMPTGTTAPEKLWIMIGGSCNTQERRDMDAEDCDTVDERDHDVSKAQYDVKIPLADVCSKEGTSEIFFLFVDVIPTSEPVDFYGVAPIPIDTEPPGPAENVQGGEGETAIPVTWDDGTGNPTNYWVLWEPLTSGASSAGGGENGGEGGCTSTRLLPGEPFDPEVKMEGIFHHETKANISQYDLSAEQVMTERAVVAVIAEDLAGNRSVLSNIDCVTVVPAEGFWDDYKESGGEAEPGCACSVPSKSGGSAWSALPLALALFGLQLRRARRRS